jgi:hypothetical protein
LKQDIQEAVKQDPTKTVADISKGYGLGYNPASFSPAAANRTTITHIVNKHRIDFAGMGARKIIQDFHQLVKRKVDEKDSENAESVEYDREIVKLCSPYRR